MKSEEKISDTLSKFNIDFHYPYYISSGNPVFKFPQTSFRMDHYSVGICIAGSIHLKVDNTEYTLLQNTIFVSAPSTVIRVLDTSNNFRMQILFFEKNFLLKNISHPFIIEKMALFGNVSYTIIEADTSVVTHTLSLLDYIRVKTSSKGRFADEIIRTNIFTILLEIAELIDSGDNKSTEIFQESKNLYFRFIKLVQDNLSLYRDVKFYANELCVSSKYLIEITKKASGKTPHQIIDENLLKEAYVLLNNPSANITAIAYKLNFSSVAAFSRFFKKYTSVSPSFYRKNEGLS